MTTEIIVSAASLIVAFGALLFSIVSFNRQQKRAEAHAKASVKPILSIRSQSYIDLKSIRLINNGIGPAIVKKAEFRRNPEDDPKTSIVELFNLPIIWETFVNMTPNRAISAEGEVVLIKISLRHLKSQDIAQDEALSLLREWQRQKTGINVRIEYEDIYGNQMPILEEVLS